MAFENAIDNSGIFGPTPYDRQEELLNAQDAVNADNFGFTYAALESKIAEKEWDQYRTSLDEDMQIMYADANAIKGWTGRERNRQYTMQLQGTAYEKALDSYSSQMDFNRLAGLIALNDTARSYEDTLTSLGFQDRDLLLKYYEGGQTAAYETSSLTDRIVQADEIAALQVKGTALNKEIAQAQAALDKAGLRQGLDETRAKAGFKMQDLRREYVQKEGAQRNLGQAGRSAGKALQALLASHGATQAAIVDSITRADASEALNFRRISEGLMDTAKKTNLRYEEISKNLEHTVQQAERAQEGIGLKFSQLGTRTEFGREQVQASKDSAERQNAADQQRILMDKYQADLSSWGNVPIKPIDPPMEELPFKTPKMSQAAIPQAQMGPKPVRGINQAGGNQMLNLFGAAADVGMAYVNPIASAAGEKAATNLFG